MMPPPPGMGMPGMPGMGMPGMGMPGMPPPPPPPGMIPPPPPPGMMSGTIGINLFNPSERPTEGTFKQEGIKTE
jgi:hypothetical protein